MSKFASSATTAKATGPVTASDVVSRTYEGGRGFGLDARSTLFTLAVTNMVGEATFYEAAGDRDARFVNLVHEVTKSDPAWMQGFIPWLRTAGLMRSATVVAAVEYARAGGPNARQVIARSLGRADEPAEALAYWLGRYGRKVPMAVKKGIADAAVRFYTEQTALKWDSAGHALRPGDVIELCHPVPRDPAQAAVFRHLIDRRHNRPTTGDQFMAVTEPLAALREAYTFDSVPEVDRRTVLAAHGLPKLYTWERLSSWLPGGMDAAAWEAVIPDMGYMALLRNLRNFEKAGIGKPTVDLVRRRLTDPGEVGRARQFPYRFFSAHKALDGSLTYARELEEACTLATGNIPEFAGRTLVMVDASGSMWTTMSGRSKLSRHEAAGVFGASVALRNPGRTDVWAYGTSVQRMTPRAVMTFVGQLGSMGGTNTWGCTTEAWRQGGGRYDRILIITDEQSHDSHSDGTFGGTPIYVWNLAGYGVSTINPGSGRYVLGGLSDASFNVVPLLERGSDAGWPWEIQASVRVSDGGDDGDDA
jgi:hypothetical protein